MVAQVVLMMDIYWESHLVHNLYLMVDILVRCQ